MNFPNLDIQPSDFVINCELGTSAEEILTLTNNGPVSVVYKFLWLADSIDIQRDSDVVPVGLKMKLHFDLYETTTRRSFNYRNFV